MFLNGRRSPKNEIKIPTVFKVLSKKKRFSSDIESKADKEHKIDEILSKITHPPPSTIVKKSSK